MAATDQPFSRMAAPKHWRKPAIRGEVYERARVSAKRPPMNKPELSEYKQIVNSEDFCKRLTREGISKVGKSEDL
jgi:hypothetical protein